MRRICIRIIATQVAGTYFANLHTSASPNEYCMEPTKYQPSGRPAGAVDVEVDPLATCGKLVFPVTSGGFPRRLASVRYGGDSKHMAKAKA